ncbi:MAG: AAA family ATPase [Candidatus Bathyarchaeia archaeon]
MDFSAFEKAYAYTVFKDKSVLSPSYVPTRLVCREEEEFKLSNILFLGVKDGFLPPMVRVFGKPGSGKTVVVKRVLEEFSAYTGNVFRYFYVNLKNCRTVFSAGNALLSAVCGQKVPVNLGLDRVFLELWTAVEKMKNDGVLFFVFVLDEADSIFLDIHFDASDFFYRIIRASTTIPELNEAKICVITITNNLTGLEENLDARVKSSMGSEFIFFSGYTKETLEEILRSRIDDAFEPNQVTDEVLSYCAELAAESGGDARKAIELLKIGGENTVAKYGKVKKETIRNANKEVENGAIIEVLRSFPMEAEAVTFLLAVYALNTEKTVTTMMFYSYYSRMSFGEGVKKLGQRRVLDIINDLEKYGILNTCNVSKGRGGYRKEINLAIDPQIIIDYNSRQGGFKTTI